MKPYLLGAVLVMILLLLSMPRLVLVPLVVQELEDEVGQFLQAQQVQVQLEAPWGWELVFGRLPRLDIVANDARMDALRVFQVTIHGEQIRFDPRSLWQDKELVYTEASSLWGEMILTEEDLNAYFWQEVDQDRLLRLRVAPGEIGLGGQISLWNMEWTITLLGDLEVHQGSSLRFVLKNLEVQETRIPSVLLEVLSEHYDFVVDFGVFPYPVELREVHLQEEQILVTFGGL
ncbi:MAG: DUF2993 domain-containing protein [Bacillota bacterium]|jgi:hypothetical protein|nr:DUF2993 domain-containing protein [Bacillota bacterium]